MSQVHQPIAFVVDDERNIADTLAIILRKNGFAATAFYNPMLALSAASLNAPDLVVSDVVMPQLSGIDLVIRMRALCPNCRVLLFSGQAETSETLRELCCMGYSSEVSGSSIRNLSNEGPR
jgi:DNA-binding response OmpR family regulator